MEASGTVGPGFGVNISTALGVTVATNNTVALTWRKNGSSQTVTCTITNPSLTCADLTHSFTYVAGDVLDVQAVFVGTISAAPVWVLNVPIGGTSSAGAGSFVLVEQHTASASAELDFTTCFSATYDDYQIRIVSLVAASGGANLIFQFHASGAYDGGTNYTWQRLTWDTSSSASGGGSNQTSIQLAPSAATNKMGGELNIFDPLSASADKEIVGHTTNFAGSDFVGNNIAADYLAANAADGFRVMMSGGVNLASGTVRCYGLTH